MCVVFLCGVLSVSGVSVCCMWYFCVVCSLSVSGALDLDSVMCGLSLWCVSVSGTSDVVSASCACSVC